MQSEQQQNILEEWKQQLEEKNQIQQENNNNNNKNENESISIKSESDYMQRSIHDFKMIYEQSTQTSLFCLNKALVEIPDSSQVLKISQNKDKWKLIAKDVLSPFAPKNKILQQLIFQKINDYEERQKEIRKVIENKEDSDIEEQKILENQSIDSQNLKNRHSTLALTLRIQQKRGSIVEKIQGRFNTKQLIFRQLNPDLIQKQSEESLKQRLEIFRQKNIPKDIKEYQEQKQLENNQNILKQSFCSEKNIKHKQFPDLTNIHLDSGDSSTLSLIVDEGDSSQKLLETKGYQRHLQLNAIYKKAIQQYDENHPLVKLDKIRKQAKNVKIRRKSCDCSKCKCTIKPTLSLLQQNCNMLPMKIKQHFYIKQQKLKVLEDIYASPTLKKVGYDAFEECQNDTYSPKGKKNSYAERIQRTQKKSKTQIYNEKIFDQRTPKKKSTLSQLQQQNDLESIHEERQSPQLQNIKKSNTLAYISKQSFQNIENNCTQISKELEQQEDINENQSKVKLFCKLYQKVLNEEGQQQLQKLQSNIKQLDKKEQISILCGFQQQVKMHFYQNHQSSLSRFLQLKSSGREKYFKQKEKYQLSKNIKMRAKIQNSQLTFDQYRSERQQIELKKCQRLKKKLEKCQQNISQSIKNNLTIYSSDLNNLSKLSKYSTIGSRNDALTQIQQQNQIIDIVKKYTNRNLEGIPFKNKMSKGQKEMLMDKAYVRKVNFNSINGKPMFQKLKVMSLKGDSKSKYQEIGQKNPQTKNKENLRYILSSYQSPPNKILLINSNIKKPSARSNSLSKSQQSQSKTIQQDGINKIVNQKKFFYKKKINF